MAPETVYRRPFHELTVSVVGICLSLVLAMLTIKYGLGSVFLQVPPVIYLALLGILHLLDPDTTITSCGMLEDGTPVKTRRPLIGFKRIEEQIGQNGGYDVQIDGYRYERAYIRI